MLSDIVVEPSRSDEISSRSFDGRERDGDNSRDMAGIEVRFGEWFDMD
jgi:hypothetical protein